jgi:hypothetical protein
MCAACPFTPDMVCGITMRSMSFTKWRAMLVANYFRK